MTDNKMPPPWRYTLKAVEGVDGRMDFVATSETGETYKFTDIQFGSMEPPRPCPEPDWEMHDCRSAPEHY